MAMDGDKAILPQDIIINILKRLPVKSLIRFQAVCKDWKNLFKTPSFIADHLHHSDHKSPFLLLQRLHREYNPLNLCLFDSEMEVLKVQNTPLIDSLSRARVVGSSDGLLCVRDGGGFPHLLFLWNPAMREIRQVPRTINDFKGASYVGFGFSPIVNDYKIVRVYFLTSLNLNQICCVNRVEVYSFNKGSWKEVEFRNIQSVSFKSDTVIANGAMFWLGFKMVGQDEDDRDMVIAFDLAMEVFMLISMPASVFKSNYNKPLNKLTVYENKLAMFSYFEIGHYESLTDLWVIEEGTGASRESWSWTKKYTIGPIPGILYPLSIWRNEIVCNVDERSGLMGESDSESEVEDDGEKFVLSLFNPTTNELKKLNSFRYWFDHNDIFNYKESLVPVSNIHLEESSS